MSDRAFVLHKKPYLESSLWLDLWTCDQGRLSAIVKGARRPQSPYRGLLEPHQLLWVDCRIRSDRSLYTLWKVEAEAPPIVLKGMALLSALYMNRLLVRMLPLMDAMPTLFQAYQQSLLALEGIMPISVSACAWILRCFESHLLDHMGYGIEYSQDAQGAAIEPTQHYVYQTEQGFIQITDPHSHSNPRTGPFLGHDLLALALREQDYILKGPGADQLFKAFLQTQLGFYSKKQETEAANGIA